MNYGKSATMRRIRKFDSKGTKIKSKVKVLFCKFFLAIVIVFGAVGISSGIGVLNGIIDSAPDISAIDVTPTGYSSTVLASNGEETATLVASGANRQYATLDQIPIDLQHAFVAIEDERFYDHNGIDLYGIARAFASGIKNGGDFDQGASTITQQLIKNNVLTSWTSETSFIEKLQRKIQEQYLSLELEKQVNKNWIIENYMNSINLGANTLGVQAASEKYFNKDVSELTLSECAVIAGITQNPALYNPITHPDKNAKRRKKVLENMKEQNYITKAQFDEAMADDVYSRIAEYNSSNTSSVNSYFVDALIDNVFDDLIDAGYSETEAYKMIYQGGLTIYSTQDLNMQTICDEEANNPDNYPSDASYSFQLSFQVKKADGSFKSYSNQTMLSYYKAKTGNEDFSINYATEDECYSAIAEYEQAVLEEGDSIVDGSESININLEPQVAMTVIDQATGEVKALVGGRGDKTGNRTWNRATDTCRQPGSTFKIIGCYAAALDSGGLTLASVQDDAPFTVGSKTFNNYDHSYRGFTNIRMAITKSINIVTVKTLQEIGVDLGYQYAESFGISTLAEDDRNLSLALGGLTNGVTNLELTGAYATIANGGTYMEPKFYTKVLDHDGNVLLDKSKTQDTHTVLKETTAWLLTDAMKDVITSGTGTKASFGGSMAQAGKSGTTTSNRDCLWAGYTPYYTCVVWGGNDDNSKQSGSLTSYPKAIWKAAMGRIHEGLEAKDFDIPDGITTAEVCSKSGLLPLDGVCYNDPRGSMVYTEYFDSSTVPDSTCDHHVALDICADSGYIANLYCPNVESHVFMIGGSSGSADSEFMADDTFLNTVCTLHDANTLLNSVPSNSTTPGDSSVLPGSQAFTDSSAATDQQNTTDQSDGTSQQGTTDQSNGIGQQGTTDQSIGTGQHSTIDQAADPALTQ